MNDADRDRLRDVQDRWLKLPRVQRWIDRSIRDGQPNPKITEGNISGPTVADVAGMLLPDWEWYFANAVENEDG